MEDFSALAARIAVGIGELRGCLILSRDGLELGSYPPGEEALVKPAWLRFAQLGDPEKGFVEFGEDLWVYVRRGPYAVFAVSSAMARPGLLMDQLEQLLLAAEETRSTRQALKLPEVPDDAPDAPKDTPRIPILRGLDPPSAQTPRPEGPERTEPVGTSERVSGRTSEGPAKEGETSEPDRAKAGAEQRRFGEREPAPRSAPGERPLDPEVDRVLLAQEFSRLLQERRFDDEDEATRHGAGGGTSA
jgi:hypothetical protein